MRPALPALLLLLLAGPSVAAAPPADGWGRDLGAGDGPRLIAETRTELLKIVNAPAADQAAAIEAYATGPADGQAEAWKRFRSPALKPLFLRLLRSPDWRTVHRALFALERFEGPDVLPAAWQLLTHAERRIREKAAITCIKCWKADAARKCSGGDWKNVLEVLVKTEHDPHVKRCLEALRARTRDELVVQKVHIEFTVKDPDGLVAAPFLDGMAGAKSVAPLYTARRVKDAGGGGWMKAATESRFTTPLMDWGKEEVPGAPLLAFGSPMADGTTHVGKDVGACLDGAGFYAAAGGSVRLIQSGGDAGAVIVVEHHCEEKRLTYSVYLHGGDTVFVKAGAQVGSGQLLGTVGMSWSLENGGRFAHLHYGLYPGPFQPERALECRKTADGLRDWQDPAVWIPRWLEWSDLAEQGSPEDVVKQANRIWKAGWPNRALLLLISAEDAYEAWPAKKKIVNDARTALLSIHDWDRATEGEAKVEALEEATSRAGNADLPKLKERWKSLLAELGDTDLRPRILEGMVP